MGHRSVRLTPSLDTLEVREALSTAAPAVVDPSLVAYAQAYQSRIGQPNYNPALDFNHNGFIGQGDAPPLLRTLAPVTPRTKITLHLALESGQQIQGHHPANSGGVTRLHAVTIVGKTTPNSIVFTDAISGPRGNNYRFEGPAIPVNSQGYFTFSLKLKEQLTNTEFWVYDPFGGKTLRAFPILRLA